jgi:hypothetical protein
MSVESFCYFLRELSGEAEPIVLDSSCEICGSVDLLPQESILFERVLRNSSGLENIYAEADNLGVGRPVALAFVTIVNKAKLTLTEKGTEATPESLRTEINDWVNTEEGLKELTILLSDASADAYTSGGEQVREKWLKESRCRLVEKFQAGQASGNSSTSSE